MDEKLMTVKEVNETLQLSEQHVYKLIREKRLKAIKIGRAVRVRRSDLEDFIARNVTTLMTK